MCAHIHQGSRPPSVDKCHRTSRGPLPRRLSLETLQHIPHRRRALRQVQPQRALEPLPCAAENTSNPSEKSLRIKLRWEVACVLHTGLTGPPLATPGTPPAATTTTAQRLPGNLVGVAACHMIESVGASLPASQAAELTTTVSGEVHEMLHAPRCMRSSFIAAIPSNGRCSSGG